MPQNMSQFYIEQRKEYQMIKQKALQTKEEEFNHRHKMEYHDIVLELQRYEKKIWQSIMKVDVLFVQKYVGNRKELLVQQTEKEKANFEEYVEIYRLADRKTQRPYEKSVRVIKKKLKEHENSLSLLLENPEQFEHVLEDKRAIWEDEVVHDPEWKWKLRGFLGLLGAFFLHFIVGAIYRWAMINTYITSYYKITNDPYIQTKQGSIGTPIMMLGAGLTMKIGLSWGADYGKQLVLGIGVIWCSLMLFISSYMPSQILFILFHCFGYGLGAGILFLIPMRECQKYFPRWRLLINSFVLVGTGLGGELFGVYNTQCMNPYILEPQASGYYAHTREGIAFQMPLCIRYTSIMVLVLGVMGCTLMYSLLKYNSLTDQFSSQERSSHDFQFCCADVEQGLKSGVFWKIMLMVMLSIPGNYFTTMNYKNNPKQTIHDTIFLNYVVLAGGVLNGLSRMFWGALFQKIGFKYTYVIAMTIDIASFFLMPHAIYYYELYIIVYSCICITTGGFMVLMQNLCLLVFGQKVGNQIYAYYWFGYAFTSFLQYFIRNMLTPTYKEIDFYKIFIIMGFIGFIVGVSTTFQGKWENSLRNLTF